MGVHTFRISKFRNLEPVHKLLHPLRLHFGQVGLCHIVHRERLDERNDIHILLLFLAHCTVFFRAYPLAVTVLYHHIPVHHREGLFTLQDMSLQVMRLLEGQIYRKLVVHGRSMHLKEEGIGTGIVAATHILRKSGIT